MNSLEKVVKFLSTYFALLVILAATLAYLNPPTFKIIVPFIPQLLGVVMLGMGLTRSPRLRHISREGQQRKLTVGGW